MKQAHATPPFYRAIDFWEQAAFWLLLVLQVVPLCGGRYFPTADGPTHLYNAWLWKAMLLEPAHPAHQVLAFNLHPEPNYLSHLLLAGLLALAPPWLAEKLLLVLYVVGLPLALRYALRSARQAGAGGLAVLGFPFVVQRGAGMGLLQLLPEPRAAAAGQRLLAAAHWPVAGRYYSRVCRAAYAALRGAPDDVPGLGAAAGAFGTSCAGRARPAQLLAELGVLLLAHFPTLLLLTWYTVHKGVATSQPALAHGTNLWEWFRLEPIHYFGSAEASYRWLVAGLLTATVVAAGGRIVRRQAAGGPVLPWALGLLLLLGAYVALPDAIAGGSIIRPRWGLLSYLTLLAGLATVPWSPRWRLLGLGAGTLVAALLLGFRLPKFRAFQAGVAEYESLSPFLRPGATILPIAYGPQNSLPEALAINTYIPALSEAINYLAVEHQLLSYDNYEALTGYFPLVWRPGKTPLLPTAARPARLAPFLAEPVHLPTYVLLQGRLSAPSEDTTNATLIAAYLAHFRYELRYRSPNNLLELYERPAALRPSAR